MVPPPTCISSDVKVPNQALAASGVAIKDSINISSSDGGFIFCPHLFFVNHFCYFDTVGTQILPVDHA